MFCIDAKAIVAVKSNPRNRTAVSRTKNDLNAVKNPPDSRKSLKNNEDLPISVSDLSLLWTEYKLWSQQYLGGIRLQQQRHRSYSRRRSRFSGRV